MKENMKETRKIRIRPILFVLAGIIMGYLYYRFVGCSSGSCMISSNLWFTMGYTGLVGWLLSSGCCCCDGSCDID